MRRKKEVEKRVGLRGIVWYKRNREVRSVDFFALSLFAISPITHPK